MQKYPVIQSHHAQVKAQRHVAFEQARLLLSPGSHAVVQPMKPSTRFLQMIIQILVTVIWMFPKIGIPQNWMVKIMENPIKIDDLGVPLFLETPIYTLVNVNMAGWKVDPDWRCFILLEIGIFHCYVSLPEFFSMGQTTTLQLNSRITQAKQKGKVFGKWKWLAAELLFLVDFILLLDFEKLVQYFFQQFTVEPIRKGKLGLGYYFEGLGFEACLKIQGLWYTFPTDTNLSNGSHGVAGGGVIVGRPQGWKSKANMKMSRSDQNSDLHFSKFYSLLIWWQSKRWMKKQERWNPANKGG